MGNDDRMAGGRAHGGIEAQSGQLVRHHSAALTQSAACAGWALIDWMRSRSNRVAREVARLASA